MEEAMRTYLLAAGGMLACTAAQATEPVVSQVTESPARTTINNNSDKQ
jgi:hypothetical protein